jgi:biopolymer transport protein ExbB
MKTSKPLVVLGIASWLGLGLLLPCRAAGTGQDFGAVQQGIEKEAGRAARDARLTEELLRKDEAELKAIVAGLTSQVESANKRLDGVRGQFEQLSRQELELQKELAEEHRDVEEVEGSVRGALKDAASMVRDNPITAQVPERARLVNAMMDSKRFPGMDGIRSLVDLYFQELQAGGAISRYTGSFVEQNGETVDGEILRAGRLTAYYRLADSTVGFLKPEPTGERLLAVAGKLPQGAEKAIRAFFDNRSTVLPVDPSGGAVFAHLTEETDWREYMEQGGVVMWPILALAGLAALILIERLIVLVTTKGNSDEIMERIDAAARRGNWEECRTHCERNRRIPTCRMIESTLQHIGASKEVLENALQEAILQQMPRMERFLPTLAVLATIAPLLGLLGTVNGMINIFRVITVVGTGDPRVMSGGISEALLTTQFGLCVAIPIMIVHHLLERRVDKIAGDMEEKGTAFVVTLVKTGAVTEGEAQRA